MRKEVEIKKIIVKNLMKRKSVLNDFVVVGGTIAMMAREGFCFYIFHQPKLPEAFREKE